MTKKRIGGNEPGEGSEMNESSLIHFEHVDSESCVWNREEEQQSRVKKFSMPALD